MIRSHIIADAFYEPVMGTIGRAVVLRPTEPKFTQTIQTGIFDRGIMCAECDGFLGRLDEHGLRIFKNPPAEAARVIEGRVPGYYLPCDDFPNAQKFLLSVLWRASVSSNDFFQTVSLGKKYEDKIRHLITGGETITAEDFEFVVIRFHDHPIDSGVIPPWRVKFPGGINAYNLYLPHFKFIIRFDQRRLPPVLSICQFKEGAKPNCLRLSYRGSHEEKIIANVISGALAKGPKHERHHP